MRALTQYGQGRETKGGAGNHLQVDDSTAPEHKDSGWWSSVLGSTASPTSGQDSPLPEDLADPAAAGNRSSPYTTTINNDPSTSYLRSKRALPQTLPESSSSGVLGSLFGTLFTSSGCCNTSGANGEAKSKAALNEALAVLTRAASAVDFAPHAERASICSQAFRAVHRSEREAWAYMAALPADSQVRLEYAHLQECIAEFDQKASVYAKDSQAAGQSGSNLKDSSATAARALASRLDELELALDKADTTATDRASRDYEETRLRIASNGGPTAAKLLLSLRGKSKWSDPTLVQALLRQRSLYLEENRFNRASSLLQGGASYDLTRELLAYHSEWEDVLRRTLSTPGAEDWRQRGRKQVEKLHELQMQSPRDRKVAPQEVNSGGGLVITRIRAGNFAKTDYWDESDSYVTFRYSGEEKKTSICYRSNCPEFRTPGRMDQGEGAWQELSFHVDSLDQNPTLHIEIFDYDRFLEDRILGRVEEHGAFGLNLKEVLRGHYRPGSQGSTQTLLNPHQLLPSVTPQPDGKLLCYFPLKDLTGHAVQDCGFVEFLLHFDPTIGELGDPLVLQPESEDESLLIVGRMDVVHSKDRQVLNFLSMGFFVDPLPGSKGGNYSNYGDFGQGAPSDYTDEVWDYNQQLNTLARLTSGMKEDHWRSDPRAPLSASVTTGALADEVLARQGSRLRTYLSARSDAVSEFRAALERVRALEAGAMAQPARWRAFAQQDELLPSIGEWSLERRKGLRNQVFLVKRWLDDAANSSCFNRVRYWLPLSVSIILTLYALVLIGLELGTEGYTPILVATIVVLVVLLVTFTVAVCQLYGEDSPSSGMAQVHYSYGKLPAGTGKDLP